MKAKNAMKRFGAMIMTILMMVTLAMPAMAAPSDTANITINDGNDAQLMSDSIDRTFAGYRLLDLTTSLKAETDECHEKEHPETTEHTDACYNYAYTVNETYRGYLDQVVFANWDDTLGEKPESSDKITNEQIIAYIGTLSSDEVDLEGNITMGTVRGFIEEVFKLLNTYPIPADVINNTGIFTKLDQGYWMFVDYTNLEGENASHSLIIVDTRGEANLEVTPKVSIPTVEKKVWQNDTADSDDLKNEWGDYADWNIGDDVPFKLTGTIAEHYDYYETYEYIFHDDLSEGLRFNGESVKVTIDGQEVKPGKVNDAGEVSGDYFVMVEYAGRGYDFHVVFEDLKKIKEDINGNELKVTKDSVIVVEYTAKLLDTAVIGNDGNPNMVRLEFSNNPNGEGTGLTPEDKVVVFTFELDGTKVDANNPEEKLEDAWFVLYREVDKEIEKEDPNDPDKTIIENVVVPEYATIENGKVTGWSETKPTHKDVANNDVDGNIQSDKDGFFKISGLDQNIYYLEETVAPAGFNLLKAPIKLDVKAAYTDSPDESGLHKVEELTIRVNDEVDDSGNAVSKDGNVDTGIVEITVENSSGVELPSTGGMGTTIFYVIGSILVVGAAILFITRKRMSVDSEN